MVIPWLGFPLADVIRRAEPMASAKFVEFTTLYDPEQMPGQKAPILTGPTSRDCGWMKHCIR